MKPHPCTGEYAFGRGIEVYQGIAIMRKAFP
jgi:hypothetical protein